MFETHLSARQRPVDPSQMYNHSRTRTTSSNVFPAQQPQYHQPQHPQPPQQHLIQNLTHAQRSSSVNTFSTVSSGGMVPPAAYRTSPNTNHTEDAVRRSTSSRSGTSTNQASYVALLRRQKGTVWSERAQFEDPRITAQQRAARIRANREILGSSGGASGAYLGGFPGGSIGGRTSTGLSSAGGKVAAKIRHHGSKSNTLGIGGYGADSNYVGIGGVPLRLSATEVEPEDSDDEDAAIMARTPNHRRTGSSGRSSTASGRRGPPYRTSTGALNPPSGANSLQGKTPERLGSLVDDAASGKARSTASGSSAERADHVPDLSAAGPGGRVAAVAANSKANATLTRERSTRNPEDLRRRGSVDERTMTLSTGRLFIANPD